MQTKPNWKLCFHMGKRSRWLQAQPCCYYMAGATSHKLGVDLMIIWAGDVGGKREGRGKRVGCCYPDLTDQPSPDVNPRLVTVKWRGLSSSAVCGRSHRWRKKIPLSSLKSQWRGWWGCVWGGLKVHSGADQHLWEPSSLPPNFTTDTRDEHATRHQTIAQHTSVEGLWH